MIQSVSWSPSIEVHHAQTSTAGASGFEFEFWGRSTMCSDPVRLTDLAKRQVSWPMQAAHPSRTSSPYTKTGQHDASLPAARSSPGCGNASKTCNAVQALNPHPLIITPLKTETLSLEAQSPKVLGRKLSRLSENPPKKQLRRPLH